MQSEAIPQLLVSVRSAAEASAACAGGCDLLDVKEPSRGSLGMAEVGTMEAVCRCACDSPHPPAVSVALGELVEWCDGRSLPKLPTAVTFAKLGLGGSRGHADWVTGWRRLRSRFEAAAERKLMWIAVIYADSTAEAPDSAAVIDAAVQSGCRGVLVDTFAKNGRGLFDHVTPQQLAEWRSSATASGLMFAVAGSLRAGDLSRLVEVRPDIVAIRGAACRDGVREGAVCLDAVRRFRQALQSRPRRPV